MERLKMSVTQSFTLDADAFTLNGEAIPGDGDEEGQRFATLDIGAWPEDQVLVIDLPYATDKVMLTPDEALSIGRALIEVAKIPGTEGGY